MTLFCNGEVVRYSKKDVFSWLTRTNLVFKDLRLKQYRYLRELKRQKLRRMTFNDLLKNSITYRAFLVFMGLVLLACTSTKRVNKQNITLDAQNHTIPNEGGTGTKTRAFFDLGLDNHSYISLKTAQIEEILVDAVDSSSQIANVTAVSEIAPTVALEAKSPVARKIVENYLNSANKEPDGHCLEVSKIRFETAYKQVHGHSPYQDLPVSMGTKSLTPKQVFNLLYASASVTGQAWRSLPEEYRGKGNAGAIAYAGMGALIDSTGIWTGRLRPGALMQVWHFKKDYEQVVQGVDVKKLDPYGHSFIFISYVRDENKTIIGLQIADQGFQSYRPLLPRDYEVWWGVNLSI